MLFAFRPLPRFGRLLNLLATKSKRNRCIYHRRQTRGFVVAGVGEVVGEENPSSSRDKNKREKKVKQIIITEIRKRKNLMALLML